MIIEMETFNNIVSRYVQHKDYIDFVKDVIFAIGVIASFYGYFKFLKFLTQRRTLYKRQEMENDTKIYGEIRDKLKEYVEDYGATPTNLRDTGIRLLYMKNYPYNLDNDGFKFMLYYYFMTEHHKPSGYISGKGLYVLDYIRYFSDSIYINPKNGKWFIDKEGQSFKKYKELEHAQLLKRIPFTNIFGYDFNSDWAEGEPVFYTKYRYNHWKLFANDLEAVTQNNGEYPLDRVSLQKNKRARKFRTLFRKSKNIIRNYFMSRKTNKLIKTARKRKNKTK